MDARNIKMANILKTYTVLKIIIDYHQYSTDQNETWSSQAIFSQYM